MGHDLWFALRRIRLHPLHSTVVALTLGLGIGASVAVFGVVDSVLLRPLPFPDPGRLVQITQTIPLPGFPELSLSDVAFRRMATQAGGFDALAAWQTRDANLIRRDASRRLIVARVSARLFDVLRVRPAIGRAFAADEDMPGGPRVVVLSNALWRSAFNADPRVLGAVINLEGEPVTVVGVLGPTVTFPSRDVAAWEPLRLDPAAVRPYDNSYAVVGRLKAGVSRAQAGTDLTAIVRAVGREFPGPHAGSTLDQAGYSANIHSLAEAAVGDVRPVVVLLLAGVILLLLMTCANVANLQLAGLITRGEELAVRAALGASRARLIRGALFEGILLTAAGGIAGFAIAAVGARLLAVLIPAGIAADAPLLGIRAIVVTICAIVIIGAVVGAVPVAVVARQDPANGLRDRSAAPSPVAAGRIRRVLASSQVAMAILLLHSSGLLMASAGAVQKVDLGFRPDSVLSLRINLPAATLRDRKARESLLRALQSEIAALPSVTAAGLVNALPLTPGRQDQAMAVEGRPFKADGTDPMADYRVVSAGYFAAMQIPVSRGRLFSDNDATATNTPLVISERLAGILFPDGADPVGHRLRFGPASPWMPIVGVVANAKNRSLTDEARPELYTPGLGTWSSMAFQSEITVVARARGNATSLAGPIRTIIARAAPDVAIYNLFPLGEVVRNARARMTVATRLMSGYAVAALLLAIAGVYAVLSYLVTQRKPELAVRMALGASPGEIVGLVGRESAGLVGAGALIGLAGAMLSARLLSGMLYGVGALDPIALLVVAASAALTGLVAGLLPARRAALTDPGAALRRGG